MRKAIVLLYVIIVLFQTLQFMPPSVNAAPTDLKVYAEAASFARLDQVDPNGWFYEAVLYNPTASDIVVTGLRWVYNASVKIIDSSRAPTCYDTRYFSSIPNTLVPNDQTTLWEYTAGSISITVPAKKMILTWIEVPTGSVNNDAIKTNYFVQAYAGGQWISSPLYVSRSGHDDSVSTVFRADFDLATDPNSERHAVPLHQNPEWLFKEDRFVVAELSRRVRLMPVASCRNEDRISSATVNVMLPAGWSYVSGSAFNPYGEAITYFSVGGKDRLVWSLNGDIIRYANNQSMSQNYIEFNVTAPSTPGLFNFTVTALVTSSKPRTAPEVQDIHVVVRTPPTAAFAFSPTTPLVNQSVTFNASSSSDLDGAIANYSWNFGDGETANGAVVSHAFSSLGNKTVTLTVTDNDGLVGIKSTTLLVIKTPVAAFTISPASPLVNELVTFNASASTPNGGAIVSYSWDFGDSQTDMGVIVTHSYSGTGNYTVILNITDSEGVWDTETKQITVTNTPLAVFSYSPARPLVNQSATFNASLSAANGGFIVEYYWDFGDGEVDSGVIVVHSYADFGNYTVTLTITDSEGLNDTDAKTIRVYSSPFVSFTYSPQQPCISSLVTFNATASQDFDGDIALYRWDFGDGNITDAHVPTITHVYAAAGDFTAFLTACDNDGFNNTAAQTLTIVVHNIAIISITPSATEVQAGQQVNITVVVKNKGTISETFNVTAYFNRTTIGTHLVEGLAPNAEIILTFVWNTSGLADGSVYTIKAETSQIIDEMDISDNNVQGGTVKIASSTPPPEATPSNFLDTILPYAIPIGAVIASILLLAVVTTLKKSGKSISPVKTVPSEFQPFTDLVGGELPDAYSVMIIGEASAGKSILCQQFANKYLNQGKPCVYVTYDCFPDEIRSNMKNFGWDITIHEQNGLFAFVDGYSSIAGKASPEKHLLQQPFALSEVGINISIAMGELTQKSPRVFLDSTVPLFTRLDPAKVAEFLQDRSAQIKGENGIFFFTIGQGTIPQDQQHRLEEIVDCIIDLEMKEQKGETARRLRIRKMRGRPVSGQWMKFSVDKKKGFTRSS